MHPRPRHPFESILRHWSLLKQLTIRGIKSRYQTSMLGLVWAFITPLFLLCIYTFVFSVVFKARWNDGQGVATDESKVTFALTLLCGMSVFNIFSESVNNATTVIINNPNYVKKVVFPLELLPLSIFLTTLFFGAVWILITVAGIFLLMQRFCVTSLSLPLVLLPLVFFTSGVCWIVSSLGTYIRDLAHVVTLAVQMLFFLSPVFYSAQMVPLPYRYALYLNPLAPVIEQVRDVLLHDRWPDWWVLGGMSLVSLVFAQLGFMWFVRTKRGFADVI